MAFHQYNKAQYNKPQYNADTTAWVLALAESLSSSDARIGGAFKALADAVTSSDAATKAYNAATKYEFVFMSDTVTKSILNKGFKETIRTNDWLQITRKGSQWGS